MALSAATNATAGVYGKYEPRDSGYFHWTAQWPTDEWHCGYPVLEGAEWIELTDGQYGDFNGHNTTMLIDGHLFIGHNNHSFHAENSSGQRCLAWMYKLGAPWKRASFNKPQDGDPIQLFPLPAPMNERKFEENARYFGNPRFQKLEDGRIMALAGVFVIRRGTKLVPDGKVNTWVNICTLAREIDTSGNLGAVQIVDIGDEDAHKNAVAEGYLDYPDASAQEWVDELTPDIKLPPGRGNVAADGHRCTEFRDMIWLDEDRKRGVCMGRGENTEEAFRGYTARTADGGKTWDQPEPTNIPSGENTITLRRLPDGCLAIFGTFGDRDRSERRPLCIALSDDGRNFSRVFRLGGDDEKHQMVGVVFDETYMYVAGPHRSNGNRGRGEHFVLRFRLERLP